MNPLKKRKEVDNSWVLQKVNKRKNPSGVHAFRIQSYLLDKHNRKPDVELFRLKQEEKKMLCGQEDSWKFLFKIMDFLKWRGWSADGDNRHFLCLGWGFFGKTDSGFGTLHIILIYSLLNLLHSKHIQLQIYLKYGYMSYRCAFSKNVCMSSGAGLVETVTIAALPALCEKGQGTHF